MATKTIPGQGILPLHEGLDRYQRIEVLGITEGFLPTTKEEQVEAMGLVTFKEKPGGAAKHLAEVAIHQSRADTTDNMRAPRKLTRSYIDWMLDAQQAADDMETLKVELSQDVNPRLALATVVESTQPGLLPFLRYFDLSLLRQFKKIQAVGYDPQKVSYRQDNPAIMYYLDEAVQSWRVQQVRRQLPEAVNHEVRRQAFWLERLVEVQKHFPALRPVATEGIDRYHQRAGVE